MCRHHYCRIVNYNCVLQIFNNITLFTCIIAVLYTLLKIYVFIFCTFLLHTDTEIMVGCACVVVGGKMKF